jgi:peptidoglycan biosynthesis protein MviN/MurJ (putative lipid II flippase)
MAEGASSAHRADMSKRNVATVLWFAMGWTVGSILAIAVGLPSILGIFMGIPFAWLIRTGPLRQVWSTRIYTPTPSQAAMPGTPLATE